MKKIVERYEVKVRDLDVDQFIILKFDSYYDAEDFSKTIIKSSGNEVSIVRIEQELDVDGLGKVVKDNIYSLVGKITQRAEEDGFYEEIKKYLADILEEAKRIEEY